MPASPHESTIEAQEMRLEGQGHCHKVIVIFIIAENVVGIRETDLRACASALEVVSTTRVSRSPPSSSLCKQDSVLRFKTLKIAST